MDFDTLKSEGTTEYKKKNYAGALAAYQRAAEINPESGVIHNNIAATLMALERYQDATVSAKLALKLGDVKAIPRLVNIYTALGKLECAKALVICADALNPECSATIKASLETSSKTLEHVLSDVSNLSIQVDKALFSLRESTCTIHSIFETLSGAEQFANELSLAMPTCLYSLEHGTLLIAALISARRYEAAINVATYLERFEPAEQSDAFASETISIPTGLFSSVESSSFSSLEFAPTVENGVLTVSIPLRHNVSLKYLAALAKFCIGDNQSFQQIVTVVTRDDPSCDLPKNKRFPSLIRAAKAINAAKDKGNAAFRDKDCNGAVSHYKTAQETARSEIGTELSFLASNIAAAYLQQASIAESANSLTFYKLALLASAEAIHFWPGNAKAWVRAAISASNDKHLHSNSLASACRGISQFLIDNPSMDNDVFEANTKVKPASAYMSAPSSDGAFTSTMQAHAKQGALVPGARGGSPGDVLIPFFSIFSSPFSYAPPSTPISAAPVLNRLVFVDYYADWCGPCKKIAPLIERYAATYAPATFLKVNTDDCMQTVMTQNVSAFPTFVMYLDGTEIGRLQGADPAGVQSLIKQGIQRWRKAAPALPAHLNCPILAHMLSAVDARYDIMQHVQSAACELFNLVSDRN